MARIAAVEPIVVEVPEGPARDALEFLTDAFLVRVTDTDGRVGIGEADTAARAAAALFTAPSAHATARNLAELVIGRDASDPEAIEDALLAGTRYVAARGIGRHAISALDMAVRDLAAQTSGVPYAAHLGVWCHDRVRVYATLDAPETPDQVARLCTAAVAVGFTAVKLAWGVLGRDAGLDRELIEAAREAIGPERDVFVDGGQAYTVERAAAFANVLASHRVGFFEEPLHPEDLAGHARLAALSPVPIAGGEACEGLAEFIRLADHGVAVLQPDLSRCGGPGVAARVAALAEERGLRCVPHQYATGVLTAASLHFAASFPSGGLAEFGVSRSPLANALVDHAFLVRDGEVAVPPGPGLGVRLDEDQLARFRVR